MLNNKTNKVMGTLLVIIIAGSISGCKIQRLGMVQQTMVGSNIKLLSKATDNDMETMLIKKQTPINTVKTTVKPTVKPTAKPTAKPTPKPAVENLSYKSKDLTITIKPFVKTKPNIKYWIVHVIIKDPSLLKTAFASNKFGGARQKTSTIAKNNNAILAINADAFSYKTNKPSGIVIKEGIIYEDGKGRPMCIKDDGTMFSPEKPMTANELLDMGVRHTFNFGPLLIQNGQKMKDDTGRMGSNYPRTVLGQVSSTEYYIIVADGKRPSYSVGLTGSQLQDELLKLNVKYAYNLDGGGSSTLYFKGKVINSPSDSNGQERFIPTIIYFPSN